MVHQQSRQPNKAIRFKKIGEDIKNKLESEIKAHKNGDGKVGTIEQLEKIMYEVERMISENSSKNFTPTFPRSIVDSWGYNNELGLNLLKFNELYSKIK